jgi:hypothetical protein
MGRRGKGEGSIYRDADGKWRGFIDLGYVNGPDAANACSGRHDAK